MVLPEYRVGLLPNRATVVGDDSSWERTLLGSFVPGNETSTLSSPGTIRPLCGRFVPGNESAWERNVPVPAGFWCRKLARVALALVYSHGNIVNNNKLAVFIVESRDLDLWLVFNEVFVNLICLYSFLRLSYSQVNTALCRGLLSPYYFLRRITATRYLNYNTAQWIRVNANYATVQT